MLTCCGYLFELLLRFCRAILQFFTGNAFSTSIYFEKDRLKVTILHPIGEGAYSMIYLAQCNNQKYALKKMLLQSSELEKCAKIEVESFQKFQHANILRLITFTTRHERTGPVMFMLFPLIENGSLRNLLNRRDRQYLSKPKLREVLTDFTAICEAVNVLHSYQPSYVHQDIKPENILIAEDGTPLLTDFGSVRPANISINSRSQALRIVDEASQYSTISYRSPELFDPQTGTNLDSRTDVWAIGCLLFAWWYGYSPFECEFTDNGSIRVVECSHLRVLSHIPICPNPSYEDEIIREIVEFILVSLITDRPFLTDVIFRVRTIRSGLLSGGPKIGNGSVVVGQNLGQQGRGRDGMEMEKV